MEEIIRYHTGDSLDIDIMVEKSYQEETSLIAKDLKDNVYFLCHGICIVNGQVQSLPIKKLKKMFTRIILQSKWCEFGVNSLLRE